MGVRKWVGKGNLVVLAARGQTRLWRSVRCFLTLLIGVQLSVIPWTASAQIIADPRAPQSQQPQVTQAGNGVPVVNIQTPSNAGVSRNTYQQFDVSRQGVILNNAQKNASTQLGGWVQSNPNLQKGSARIILNEVNSTSPSQLRGYMEIAGSKAQLVVANPSGITCEGCGFINANRATLTTGTPILQNGDLTGYRVQGGRITIEGQGLDARGTDYTDIISRAVSINSGLWAEHLNVVTGTNQVSTDLSQITPIAADPNDPTPKFALDVAAVGGMFTGKIYLIGTEAGLGVINAGHIGAAVGDVIITIDGRLESKGSLNSIGNTQVTARQGIQNEGTLYAQGNVALNTSGDITNSSVIAAAGNTSLTANNIQGQTGSLISAGLKSDNSLTTSGLLLLNAGQLIQLQGATLAGHTQQLNAADLQLLQSQLQGNALYLSSGNDTNLQGSSINVSGLFQNQAGGTLNTSNAQVNAGQLNLIAQNLTNNNGLLQQIGGSLTRIQIANLLNNQNGQIVTNGTTTTITAQTLQNQAGRITSAGTLNLQAAVTNTLDGLIASLGDINLTGTLNNQAGQIQSQGNSYFSLTGTLNNQGGLLQSNQGLSITADTLDNTGTRNSNQGLEAQNITLALNQLYNQQGLLRAGQSLIVNGSGLINNTGGLISSGHTLSLQDTAASKTLALSNNSGTLIAGNQLTLNTASLQNTGEILSLGSINIQLAQNYTHSGTLQSNGDLYLQSTGALINQGILQAGNILQLQSLTLDNQATGQISAGQTLINTGVFTNRGLIDGQLTRIQADQFINLGTGRIYGDHLALHTTTLTNTGENNVGATLAAREQLHIGTQNLLNNEGALIFSGGDMSLGRTLDVNNLATGKADTLYNRSATLEALGQLQITVGQIHNLNDYFSTIEQLISSELIVEYLAQGQSTRYREGTPGLYTYSCNNGFTCIQTPAGDAERWHVYDYTINITETTIQDTRPARILSGSNMHIDADQLTNDKSHLIAGGSLSGIIGTLNNIEASGSRNTTVTGTDTSHWINGDQNDTTTTPYVVAQVEETIVLASTAYLQNTVAPGSGTQITNQNTGTVGRAPENIHTVNNGNGLHILTSTPNLTLPNNSLFRVNPNPGSSYLIETDPRFASYRQWLSSDYLLQSLGLDITALQKRLGDGFYEQRLIREQIGQLTGRRFLDGYASDEQQYQALLENGATYAQAHQLIPGVALTDAQMAALTSDIVWLVEKEVTLPDGSTTRVLVPQVYVRVQPGDLDGTGSLLAGREINLQLTGNLNNQGTIIGRELLNISGNTLENSGQMQGRQISLYAAQDLTNSGQILALQNLNLDVQGNLIHKTKGPERALLQAGQNLTLLAGNDITLQNADLSTGGNIAAQAGNKLSITAQENTQLSMGGSKTTSFATENTTWQTGQISAGGNLSLAAGTDLRIEGGKAQAGGNIALQSGGNTEILALSNSSAQTIYKTPRIRGNTLDGKETYSLTSQESIQGFTANAGGNFTLQAGKDAILTSVNLQAGGDMGIASTGNLSINAATQQNVQLTEQTQYKFGTTKTTEQHQISETVIGNRLVAGGNLVLQSGKDLSLTAVQGQGQDIHLEAAGKFTLAGLQEGTSTGSSKQTGNALASVTTSAEKTETRVASSQLTGQNLTLKTGSDARIIGSQLNLSGSAQLDIGGDLSLSALQQQNIDKTSTEYTRAAGVGYLYGIVPVLINQSVTQNLGTSSTTQAGSAIQTGQNLGITTQGAVSLTGSTLQAGQNLALDAGGPITLVSLLNTQTNATTKGNTSTSSQAETRLQGGGQLSLSTDKSINLVDANLAAGTGLSIAATEDITNLGGRLTGQDIQLSTQGNLFNLNGQMIATDNLSLSAQGNLAHHSLGQGQHAQLQAGGNLTLQAGKDLSIHSADAQAGQALTAVAGGRLDITAQQTTSSGSNRKQGSWSNTTWETSTLSAGTDLNLQSGSDMHLQAAQLQAGGNLGVQAGGNLTLSAVAEQHSSDLYGHKKEKLLPSQRQTDAKQDITYQGTELQAGGNVTLVSGNNLRIEGGSAEAGGNLLLQAAGNAEFVALTDTHSQNRVFPKWGENDFVLPSDRKNTGTDTNTLEQTTRGFTGTAGGTLQISSGKDLALTSVDLGAGSDLNLISGGNLSIKAGQDHYISTRQDSKGSQSIIQNTTAGNHLNAGGNLTLQAGQDLSLVAVQGQGQQLTLSAGRDISITGQQDSKVVESTTTNSNRNLFIGDSSSIQASTSYTGSQLTGNDLYLSSGRNTTLTGSQINLSGDALLQVGGDLTLNAAQNVDARQSVTSGGLFSGSLFNTGPSTSTDITHSGSSITTGGNLGISTGGLTLEGSRLAAGQNLAIDAKGPVLISSLVDTHDRTWGRLSHQEHQENLTQASLESGGSLALHSDKDITLLSTRIQSGDTLDLKAGGNILLGGTQLSNYLDIGDQSGTDRIIGNTLQAGSHVSLDAGKDMLILGGRIRSENGNVSLKAEGELSLLSTSDRVYSTSISSNNGFIKDKTTTKVKEDTSVNGVDISTGNNGGIALQSGGDMTLESVRLQSGTGGIALSTPGQIHFDIAQETHYNHKTTQTEWVVWQKTQTSGKRDLVGVDNQLSSTGDININAGQGVSLVYAQHRGESSQSAFDRAVSQNNWIADLESQGSLNAIALADTRKKWEGSHSGLTPLGGVIIAALTAYYTGPMFNNLVSSSASSLSSLMQKSIATGLTASTTTAVVQFGTDGKIDGDLVFKAGLVAALGSALGNAKIWGEKGVSLNEMAGIDSTYSGTGIQKATMGLTFSQDQLLGIAGRGIINAALDSAINGTSFGDSIRRGVVNDFATLAAQSIGNTWGGTNNPNANPDLQILAHMGLGGLAAGLRGDDIGAGALGGLLEGILGNMVKDINNDGLYTSGSMLASGLAAHLVGRDPVTAALAAQNAAINNRLLEDGEKERIRRLAGGDPEKEKRLVAAACALVHCSAEFVPGSPAWQQMWAIENEGLQPEYAAERELLKNQMQIGFPSATPMFEYGKWDKAGDELALYDNTHKLTSRLGGLVQVGTGALSMGGGILVGAGGCGMSAGLACAGTVVVGGGMVAWGVDQGWAGGATLINGSPEPTWGGAALSNLFGMSPQTGELLYGLAGFTVAAAGTTLSQLGTVSLKAPTPGTTGVMVGGTQYVESAAIQANTTVRLSESVALANGRILPKGSIVTVSDDAMKVVLPDGTSSISSYSKAMTPSKALSATGTNNAVPAGANLIGAGDRLAEAATWVKPQQGVFDVIVHGSEDMFHVLHNGKWVEIDQRTLSTFIQKNGYAGEPIRLISCSTGACSTGVAQNLANKLGAQVIAPSDTVWIHSNGNLTIGNSATNNTGVWNSFTPGKK